MRDRPIKRRQLIQAAGMLPVSLALPAMAQSRSIKLAHLAAIDSEYLSNVFKLLAAKHFGYEVVLQKMEVPAMYAALAEGKVDLTLAGWLPNTHKAVYEPVAARVDDLGPIYTGTRIGWVVPEYIPKDIATSLDDLKNPIIKHRTGGQVFGGTPSSGTMKASHRVIAEYGLDGWKMIDGNGDTLSAAVDDGIAKQQWFVAIAWTPHHMFAQHRLRYLTDPKGVFGSTQGVHAISRKGLENDHPKIYQLARQMKISTRELENMLFIGKMGVFGNIKGSSLADKTAQAWIGSQGRLTSAWIKGI